VGRRPSQVRPLIDRLTGPMPEPGSPPLALVLLGPPRLELVLFLSLILAHEHGHEHEHDIGGGSR
jgi:hypothetical protein